MFNNLPVIVTNYTVEFLNNVDYVKVVVGGPQAAASSVGYSDAERRLRSHSAELSDSLGKTEQASRTRQDLAADAAAKKKAITSSAATSGVAYIPSLFTITATVVMQHTPKQTRQFNMESFRRGDLLRNRKWPNSKGGWW